MLTNLSQEQASVLQSISRGENVFITGSAGTGKSYLLKVVKENYNHLGLHVTASTGIAAVHIGGVTIHSWAGIGLGNAPVSEIINYINSGKATLLRRKLRKARMLAIDEISMISAETFDLLNEVLQNIRGNNKAFGGIQLIILGDFLQLPPIQNFETRTRQYCFQSKAWEEANFHTFYLQEIFRQKNSDFAELLHRMRIGTLNEEDINILKTRVQLKRNSDIKPTIIVTHNKQVENINQQELNKLNTSEVVYNIKGEGNENKLNFLKKNCLAAEKLVLKEGAQVMMLKNTYQKEGIINGSIGVIKGFTEKRLPLVKFASGQVKEIAAEEWIIEEFNNEKLAMEVKAKITQIPLMLAWAITVHKSQGMTLDEIECDLQAAFEEGQVYVAISRVKSLEGLYLKSFQSKFIKVNQEVVQFYEKLQV
ncbi:MAG: DEAD/DEAH box helicase [Alphaproteobacteria bacterium]